MTLLKGWLAHAKKRIKKVLFVFAHPDDEILCSGGLLQWSQENGFVPYVLIMTHGEKGLCAYKHGKKLLANIRKQEFIEVMHHLHIDTAVMLSLPDGALTTNSRGVESEIERLCVANHIDLIVSHDKKGGYGHPDHKTVSKACTKIASKHRIPFLVAIHPFDTARLSPDNEWFRFGLTQEEMTNKVQLLHLYRSQFPQNLLSRIKIQQQFIPYESYNLILPIQVRMKRFLH